MIDPTVPGPLRPMAAPGGRRLAAVMFTDVVGYTALMQDDEEAARVVRLRHREALEAAIEAHGGDLVQYLGDGSLSTFASVVEAVSAAVGVQRSLQGTVALRIGIHQGEIAFDEQGVYGDSVNVAARVMGLASAGSVLVSGKARDELKNHPELEPLPLGSFVLKNVHEPVSVYAVAGQSVVVPTRGDLLGRTGSTLVYREVTLRWPWIALTASGCVLLSGLIWDGMTAVSLQSYAFAWAAASAAIWFLFDKAEIAMSDETRTRLATWLSQHDLQGTVESIPLQFSTLFDRIFGERHLSWRCFVRSAAASILTVWIVCLIWAAGHPPPSLATGGLLVFSLTVSGLVFNVLPDYLSLLETRYLLGKVRRGRWLPAVLLADLGATALLGAVGFVVAFLAMGGAVSDLGTLVWQTLTGRDILTFELTADVVYSLPLGLFFYSTFFTSIWLWLYAAAVLVSRLLLRMNAGIGFLLRATDVERQPFRATGFVSVALVSILFVLGLPILLI